MKTRRTRTIRCLLLAGLGLCLFPGLLRADFEDLGAGARVFGMGGAFVGVADDVWAVYYNPAGLGFLRQKQLGADYSRFYVGMSDDSGIGLGFLSYAHPLRKSERRRIPESVLPSTATAPTVVGSSTTVGVSPSTGPAAGGKAVFPAYGTLAVGLRTFSLSGVYREETGYLSYGKAVTSHLALGLGLKYMQEIYDQDPYTRIDPVFDYGRKDGIKAFGADAGVLWNPHARFFVGASILDLNRPDVGLKDKEPLPSVYKSGLGYRDKRTILAFDVTSRAKQLRLGVGGERWFQRNAWCLRTGMEYGKEETFSMTLGFALNMAVFQVNYGFRFPLSGVDETAGSHRVSLQMRFGALPKDELDPSSLEYSYLELKQEKNVLESKLQKTEAEKQRLEEVLLEEATQRIRERIMSAKKSAGPVSGASAGPAGESSLEFVTHYAQEGDTLQALAERYYGDSRKWKEIYEANKDKLGRGGRIKPKTVLLIPHASPAAAPRAVAANHPAPAVKDETPRPPSPVAVLKPTVPEKPAVPAPRPADPVPAAAPPPKASTAGTPKTRVHVVADGDTLKNIAERYYGDSKRWVDIYNANKDKVVRGTAAPGETLTIP